MLPVHPRVCGEQIVEFDINAAADGSSPRVRGTGHYAPDPRDQSRFIPACAGNRACSTRPLEAHSVHPRVCGEQHTRHARIDTRPGSSPRVRGTDMFGYGKSAFSAVHPRVCGEQGPSQCGLCVLTGSSPRVRGTASGFRSRLHAARFIPACAGNRR